MLTYGFASTDCSKEVLLLCAEIRVQCYYSGSVASHEDSCTVDVMCHGSGWPAVFIQVSLDISAVLRECSVVYD